MSAYKNAILTLTASLMLWTVVAIYFEQSDTCYIENTIYRKDSTFKLISSFLFYSSVVMMVFFLVQLIVWAPPASTKTERRYPKLLQNAFSVSVTLLWYVITFFICVLGKIALKDHACAAHPNSISGHYTFHIYYLLALPHLYFTIVYSEFTLAKKAIENPKKEQIKERRRSSTATKGFNVNNILLITYLIFVITTMGTLSRTWLFGFHTLRQILYGSVLATLSHYIAVVLQAIALQDKKGPLILTTIITIGLVVLGYLTMCYSVFPLSSVEVYMSLVTWGILVYYSWYKYNREKLL